MKKSILNDHYRQTIKRLSANLLYWVRMNKLSTMGGRGCGAYACKPQIKRTRIEIQTAVSLYKAAMV